MTATRTASLTRKTRETEIALTLALDGSRTIAISTGIGMLDHLLGSLAFFAGWDLTLTTRGDLHVDDHHSAEDSALALGQALDAALGDRQGLARFAHAYAPLDESLARAVVDLATRPYAVIELGLGEDRLGELRCENIAHALRSLSQSARFCLHAELLRGDNDHHRAEAAFKAVGLALARACAHVGGAVASTKGTL